MLLTLLMIQALMTLILNQTYQSMLAQLERHPHELPAWGSEEIRLCLERHCNEYVTSFSVNSIAKTNERQFFNATLTHCENEQCYRISQIFSQGSAILKEDRQYHAITLRLM